MYVFAKSCVDVKIENIIDRFIKNIIDSFIENFRDGFIETIVDVFKENIIADKYYQHWGNKRKKFISFKSCRELLVHFSWLKKNNSTELLQNNY